MGLPLLSVRSWISLYWVFRSLKSFWIVFQVMIAFFSWACSSFWPRSRMEIKVSLQLFAAESDEIFYYEMLTRSCNSCGLHAFIFFYVEWVLWKCNIHNWNFHMGYTRSNLVCKMCFNVFSIVRPPILNEVQANFHGNSEIQDLRANTKGMSDTSANMIDFSEYWCYHIHFLPIF